MFTVQVVGVGDICSFAEMDVRKHGNSKVGDFMRVLVRVCIVCQFVCVHVRMPVCVFNPLGPRPAAALALQNPMRREVTVSNDPGIQL